MQIPVKDVYREGYDVKDIVLRASSAGLAGDAMALVPTTAGNKPAFLGFCQSGTFGCHRMDECRRT